MSDPELIVRDFVLDITTVKRMVENRIYPQRIPPNATLPALSYLLVSSIPIGSTSNISTCYWSRIQLGIWAKSYQEIKELRDAILFQVKNNSRFTWQINSDTYEDESELYGQPIDFLFSH